MRSLLMYLLLLYVQISFASPTAPKFFDKSQQLLLVITPDWNTTTAIMQRYTRNTTTHQWMAEGKPFDVVVGKNGLAWGVPFQDSPSRDPQKNEGDLRAPAGIFKVGPAFGFAASATPTMKMHYLPLKETTLCVDDSNSTYYNQIIDTATIKHRDWQSGSGEQMRHVPFYENGAVVQYNTQHSVLERGSCIFMHIWRTPHAGTAGCIAMDKSNLIEILQWLDPTQHPAIAILPQGTYNQLKKNLKLPLGLTAQG